MASVKSKNNKSTELKIMSVFKDKNITGWRRNYPLLGKPDFVFPRLRIAIFIDGCFWHKCPKHCRLPASNTEYWHKKIQKNRLRDKKITMILKEKSWQVGGIEGSAIDKGQKEQRKPLSNNLFQRIANKAGSR